MKLLFGFALMIWVICGVAGGWMLEGVHLHLRSVAGGPMTLINGMHDAPAYDPRRT